MSDPRVRVVARAGDADETEVVAALDKTVQVVLAHVEPPWRHQVLALALVDLLARLFPRISLICPEGALAHQDLPAGQESLLDRLQGARAHALTRPATPGEVFATVVIGAGAEGDVYADADGWVSYLGQTPSKLSPDADSRIAIGPLVAACRAASQVAQLALGDLLRVTERVESAYTSALTYTTSTEPFNDPNPPAPTDLDAVLVGGGSIGGATVYAFGRQPGLRGRLAVVDPDALAPHNPDRAILATREQAQAQPFKAAVARNALAHHNDLTVEAHCLRFEAFVASRPRSARLPTVLSAVDSVASRREIQDAVPLEVINAACGPEEINLSGHVTGKGACVYCIHLPAVLDGERILLRLISRATGMPPPQVFQLLDQKVPLQPVQLRAIEQHRGLNRGALSDYAGEALEVLYRSELIYGETQVRTASGAPAAVAAPHITALAGFLLAGEALKAGGGEPYRPYRLGPGESLVRAVKYEESLLRSPLARLLSSPKRWEGTECLCRSRRRLRILAERYGV